MTTRRSFLGRLAAFAGLCAVPFTVQASPKKKVRELVGGPVTSSGAGCADRATITMIAGDKFPSAPTISGLKLAGPPEVTHIGHGRCLITWSFITDKL
jgi:hypothetical protein